MNPLEYEKLRWQESETVQNLLKRQNTLLGDSLENLDHLIYLQKSINLLSLQEICQVMVEKLPFILSVQYFTFFLFDKNRRRLSLASHNHPDLEEGYSLYQNDSPIMKEAMNSGRYIFEQDFSASRYFRGRRNPLFSCKFFVTIPLMIENEIIGVMNLNDNQKGIYNVGDLDFALNVSEFVALSISNAMLYERAEKNQASGFLYPSSIRNRKYMIARVHPIKSGMDRLSPGSCILQAGSYAPRQRGWTFPNACMSFATNGMVPPQP